MKGKLLIVSLHIGGGCFQYGNELISHLTVEKDVFVPNAVQEQLKIKNPRTLLFWGHPSLLRYFSLAFFLLRIFILGATGYYRGLLLAGPSSWDYYIMRIWKLTGRPSRYIVHDGVMHAGEKDTETQNKIIWIMRHASRLIFLSDYVRRNVRDTYGIDSPYLIVPHGLIDYGPLINNDTPQNDAPIILFLGRVSHYKGVDLLLKAMQSVPDNIYRKLIIAGNGALQYQSEAGNAKVLFDDQWLSERDIIKYLSVADIMVFPYREASQSGVATLAVNYAIPSIAFRVGALAEQFPENGAIIIDRPSPDALATAITRMCTDQQLRCNMHIALSEGKNAIRWDNIAKILDDDLTEE